MVSVRADVDLEVKEERRNSVNDDLPLEGVGSEQNEPAMQSAYSGPLMAFLKKCFIFIVTAAVFAGGMWVVIVVDYGDSQMVSLLLFALVLLLTGFTGWILVARLRPYWTLSGESIEAEYEEAKARYSEAKERGAGLMVARARLKKALDNRNVLLGREARWAARQDRYHQEALQHRGQRSSSGSKRFPDRDSGGGGGFGFGGGDGGFGGGGGCGGGGD